MIFTHDTRWGTGLDTYVPDDALAAYGARWIDRGDHMPADILPDRQGFAYNDGLDRGILTAALIRNSLSDFAGTIVRDQPTLVDEGSFHAVLKRQGGYIYVAAWIEEMP